MYLFASAYLSKAHSESETSVLYKVRLWEWYDSYTSQSASESVFVV